MQELIKDIRNAIDQVDEIRMVDMDLGQLENNAAPAVSFPFSAIRIDDGEMEDLNDRVQEGLLLISVRTAFRVYERTHNLAPEQYSDVGLSHLGVLETINQQLHGLSGNSYQNLVRRRFRTEPRADLRVYTMTYQVRYREEVKPANYNAPDTPPDFCIQLNTNS